MSGDGQNPRVFGKYEVIRRLAVGGMGEIFLARQTGMAGFDRLVILKSLLPQLADDADMLTQFLDEARIVGSINHPNVVACYEVGEWEGVYFIAMEYINGVDVATLQKAADDAGVRFPINVAMTIAREAGLGLDSAHHALDAVGRALKIVHRDISPHNVMVRQDGLAKVVDFGVAVAANRQKRTEGGLLKGKLGYMAPEQIKGQTLDGRSDQFSLGVMLWELLTGRRLFTAEDPHAVFMKIIRETVPPPSSLMPDVPPELDAIVLKMTAQEPADRYGRLAEVAAALRKELDHRGALETEPSDAVRGLVGAQLAARVRDLTPAPVKILGIAFDADKHAASANFCRSCGAQAVKGDRFCRSCGTPLTAGRGTPVASPPPVQSTVPTAASGLGGPFIDDDFAEEADDMIDVAFDDSTGPSEAASCIGVVDLTDGVGSRAAPESMLRAVFAHAEELASRFGGTVTTEGSRIVASFSGNGRAARSSIAFARRAGVLATRAHRDLRMRAGVGAAPGIAHGDTSAREDAERAVNRARSGTVLVSARARRLANVAQAYGPAITIPAATNQREELVVHELPPPPRMAGRAGERIVVEQAVAAADVARAQQHLILGEAGLGKTTLLDVIDAEARDRGFVIARARCGRARGALRYDVIRQIVKSACLEMHAVTGSEAPWHQALDGLSLLPADRARIVALVDDEPHEDEAVPLSRRRLLLRAALLGFFAALAARKGLCVLVDDVHKGDASSLELLAEIAARLHASRFAVFGTSRPMQGERVLPLARRVVLEPLEPKEAAQVASFAVGGALDDGVADLIAEHSGGNALVASLLARHLVAMKLLSVSHGGVRASPDLAHYPLPPTLEVLLFAAHALLPPTVLARDALVAGAQIGCVFDADEVAIMLGAEAPAVREALSACAQQGALVDEGAGRFSFPSLSEREIVAARADPAVARTWHERLAGALEERAQHKGRKAVELEERLVLHWVAADDRARAAVAAENAADGWARLGAADATAEYYRRALHTQWKSLAAHPASDVVDESWAKAALGLAARATLVVGEVDAAGAVDLGMPIVRALPTQAAVSERVEALRARATLLLRLRRPDEAEAVLDEAIDGFAAVGGPELTSSLLVDVAAVLEQAGNVDAARVQLQEALRIMGPAPGARSLDALLALGRLHLRMRDSANAREVLVRAVSDAEKLGQAPGRIDALAAFAALEHADNHPQRALTALEEATRIAADAGDSVAEARLRQQIARIHQQTGHFPEALAAARMSLTTAQRLAWDEGMAVAGQLVATLEQRA